MDENHAEILAPFHARGAFSAGAILLSSAHEVIRAEVIGTVSSDADATAVTADTLFDLASVTKPFVAAALLSELEASGLSPDTRVGDLLPELRESAVTYRELFTHTAGFAPEWWDRDPDPGAHRFRAGTRPDPLLRGTHQYSCVGYIWAGLAATALAGAPLEDVVRRHVLDPLGMNATGYRPTVPAGQIAATEYQLGRGLVHGDVHDETAWALGGVTGNAGLFAPASDVLRFAEELRDPSGALSPTVVFALTTPTVAGSGFEQTAGLRAGETWTAAFGPHAIGHTGFTGTAFATVPGGDASVVLLTNRVHPSRANIDLIAARGDIVSAALSNIGKAGTSE